PLDVEAVGHDGRQIAVERLFEKPQTIGVEVDHRYVGAHAQGDLGRLGPYGSPSDDYDLRRRHARHAAHKDAAAAKHFLQVLRPDLDGHPAGHFTHGRKARQSPGRKLNGLVGDADRLPLEKRLSQPPIGRQVQVGHEDLLVAHHRDLMVERLFHLHDELGVGVDVVRPRRDASADRSVVLVGEPAAQPGIALDDHLVASADQLFHACRREADSIFMILDLLGYPDDHGQAPPSHRFRSSPTTWICNRLVEPGFPVNTPAAIANRSPSSTRPYSLATLTAPSIIWSMWEARGTQKERTPHTNCR